MWPGFCEHMFFLARSTCPRHALRLVLVVATQPLTMAVAGRSPPCTPCKQLGSTTSFCHGLRACLLPVLAALRAQAMLRKLDNNLVRPAPLPGPTVDRYKPALDEVRRGGEGDAHHACMRGAAPATWQGGAGWAHKEGFFVLTARPGWRRSV